MSKIKTKSERTSPLNYLSVRSKYHTAYVNFVRYANRAIICRLHLKDTADLSKLNGFYGTEVKEITKARCNPGDESKGIPADVFDEKTGMGLAYQRARLLINREISSYQKTVKVYEEAMNENKNIVADLEQLRLDLDDQYAKYLDSGLLVCEMRDPNL